MANAQLEDEWHKLCDRCHSKGYKSLSSNEKLWINVRMLAVSINNGGLISYFYNTHAETYADLVTALKELDALDVLEQVQRLAKLFGDSVPVELERRNEIIDSWADYGQEHDLSEDTGKVLMPFIDPLWQKLERFLEKQGFGS